MKVVSLGRTRQNMHRLSLAGAAEEIEPSSLKSETSMLAMLPEELLDLELISSDKDLFILVKSRLAGAGSMMISVSPKSSDISRESISWEPIPESRDDIVSDRGRSASVDPPSVSSTGSSVVLFTSFFFPFFFFFFLGLSGAQTFLLSQHRVQWVMRGLFGVLQLKKMKLELDWFILGFT